MRSTSAHADTAPAAGLPATVSADALPTVQIDGVAWSQVIVGNYDYVGGSFANARPAGAAAGTNLTPRANFLRYNITTGVLDSTFAPSLNGQVLSVAASPDGTRVYVAGDFTTANGANHYRVAAYSTATGAIIPSFAPVVDAKVKTIIATNTTVYFGGSFSTVSGNSRERLAAVSASNGAVLSWAPQADAVVNAMILNPSGDKVIVAGQFQNIGTTPEYGMAALDPVSGAILPWAANATVQDAGVNASLDTLSTDGTNIYGGGYVFGAGGNLEGVFNANGETGAINWIEDCHGDTYGTYEMSGVVYVVSHEHFCGDVGGWPQASGPQTNWVFQRTSSFTTATTGVLLHDPVGGYADFGGDPAPTLLNWWPSYTTGTYTGQDQAAWTVTGNGQYLAEGGEFPSINGTAQQGLVRFAVSTIAPNKQGPVVNGTLQVPSLVSFSSGTVRVAFQANWDRDNVLLTYKVVRDGNTANPVYTTTSNSTFWNRPELGFVDTGLVPGSTHEYRVYATDPFGNTVAGNNVNVTVSSTTESPYTKQVLSDGASTYYRLGEASGTTAYDWAGFNDGIVTATGITRGAAGAINGDTDAATTFDGSTGNVATPTAVAAPQQFSAEAWINTTTTSGGKILGFGDVQSGGNSSNYDNQVYMDNAGHIIFGVYPGSVQTVVSPKTYNDGQYHHIVATLSPTTGMTLYVDGKRVAYNNGVTSGQAFTGYWRIGGDNLSGWTNQPSSFYFAGTIDDVAIYPNVLSAAQVVNHYVLSGRTSPIPPAPTDAYGALIYNSNPDAYWRLDETSGTVAKDSSVNGADGLYSGGITFGTPGAIAGTTDTAVTLDGSTAQISSGAAQPAPTVYSEELWFNTTTTNGGKLIGYGNAQTGLSSSYDRHVWMLNTGQLVFGTYTGALNTAQTTASYNDGKWHQMVATQGSDGMKLYVDGILVATNPQTAAQAYTGYWKVGGDVTWGGNNSNYFAGAVDEVATYSSELTSAQIANQYAVGSGTVTPTASFTSSSTGLNASFNGVASAETGGTIASYAWNFGDGTTQAASTSPMATHTYAQSGTYAVTLTVTDGSGNPGTTTNQVMVTDLPPTASFSSSSIGLAASFNGVNSSDTDGTVASYAWAFGDGSTQAASTSATATHTYAIAGTYSVTLTVTDNSGVTNSVTNTVMVAPVNQPPVAAFTYTNTGLAASFNGGTSSDPDGTVSTWAWNFGDGSTQAASTSATATHTYAIAGTYSVTLTVTDNGGLTNSVTNTVMVAPVNQPPVAAFTYTNTGLAASFNGGTSSDPDGTVSTWAWNFGDGSTQAASTSATATHTYAIAGTYSVTLTVTDNGGLTNSVTNTVMVAPVNQPPVAAFSYTNTGLAASFNGGGSSDPDGTVSTYAWTFGDGSSTSGTTATTTHTYAIAGTYSVTLTVTDNGGLTNSITHSIMVAPVNQPPVAAFTYTNTGLAASFNGGTSSDPDGTVSTWAWNFGDGSTQAASTSATATHTYAAKGTYAVTLTVTDNGGLTNTSTVNVTVSPTNVAPTAAFSTTITGLAAAFNGGTSTDSDGSVVSWAWNFGDGSTQAASATSTATHTYATAGSYPVTLTVTDNGGLTGTQTQTISVGTVTAYATDAFGRTVTGGWGTADVGGVWGVTGTASTLSVSAGAGHMTIGTAGASTEAYLAGVSSTSTETDVQLSLNKAQVGGGTYVSVIGRRISSPNDYRVKLHFIAGGTVAATIESVVNNTETTIKTVAAIPGLTYNPGDVLDVRLQVSGTSPTTLSAVIWKDGTTQPTTWTLTGTDSTSVLQASGGVALLTYVSASNTGIPEISTFDNLSAGPLRGL